MPAFFVLELENVYRQADGAHRALAFPDFCGYLIGLGLEQYRRQYAPCPPEAGQEEAPEGIDEGEGEDWDFQERSRRFA
jgi:hypothetical protein